VRDGTAVVAFDLRGHGRSDGERAFVRRFTDYGSDLDAERRVVETRFPSVPLGLFGHSMGGAIAARHALDRPAGLSALLLSAPALRPPATTTGGQVFGVRLLSWTAPHARVFRLAPGDFVRDPASVAAMEHDPLIDPRPIPARTAAELLRSMATTTRNAPQLRVPTVLFHGTQDRITNPEGSADFARAAPARMAELRTVPGAFHDLWHEPEAVQLRDALAGWLADH
jgi:acylglycerol lipase